MSEEITKFQEEQLKLQAEQQKHKQAQENFLQELNMRHAACEFIAKLAPPGHFSSDVDSLLEKAGKVVKFMEGK